MKLLFSLYNLCKKVLGLGIYKIGSVVRYQHIGHHGKRHGPTFEGTVKYVYGKHDYHKGGNFFIPSNKYIYIIEFKNGSLDAVGDIEIL